MAGERQTEAHQTGRFFCTPPNRCKGARTLEAELARVRAERDEAREKLDNLKFRSDQVGYVSGLPGSPSMPRTRVPSSPHPTGLGGQPLSQPEEER